MEPSEETEVREGAVLRPGTEAFLDEVERASGNTFSRRADVGTLRELAHDCGKQQVFDDILFLAKFVSRAAKILGRPGLQTDDTAKLSAEFADQMEKASTLMRTLVKESPDETKEHFLSVYLSLRNESFQNLLDLFRELSWVKNFQVDASRDR